MTDIFDKHNISSPCLLLAPMEGVTGPVFRALIDQIKGPDLVATEFIRITSKKQGLKAFARFQIPLQIQLMSCDPEILKDCILFLKTKQVLFDNDWLDLNVGCPSKRVTSRGAGSALLLEPTKLVKITETMRSVHKTGPLSIKTRIGYQGGEDFPDLLEALADCPLDFITIHARSKTAKFSGPIHFDKLAQAVKRLSFPVIGNGDIWTVSDAIKMLDQTGVRGLMCGRGAIANPYLFHDIRNRVEITADLKKDRQSQLYEFAIKLLENMQNSEKGPGKHLGLFKEFAAWLSRNPLIGREFFNNIKRLNDYPGIHSSILNHQQLAN